MTDHPSGSDHGSPSGTPGSSSISRQAALFVVLIACAGAIIYAGVLGFQVNPLLWGALLLVVALIVWMSPRVVEFMEYERGVFFRLGKFDYVAGPGVHLMFPFIDSFQTVDIRVFRVKVPSEPVITSDNITIKLGVVFMVRVNDVKKAILEVHNYHDEIADLATAELRNAVSRYTLQEVLDETEKLHDKMAESMERVAKQWGLELSRLSIESIDIPPEIKEAMDSRRQAVENKAKVETDAQARKVVLDILNEAASNLSPATMEYLYLDTLKRVADGRSTKIVLPMELSRIAETIAAQLNSRALPFTKE